LAAVLIDMLDNAK